MTFTLFINTICTALLVILPALVDIDDQDSVSFYYNLALVVCCVYGTSVALLQVTLYGVAGPIPELTIAFMVGIGLSSFLVNFLRIGLHIFKLTPTQEASIFFGISSAFLLYCTFLSFIFINRYQVEKNPSIQRRSYSKSQNSCSKIT